MKHAVILLAVMLALAGVVGLLLFSEEAAEGPGTQTSAASAASTAPAERRVGELGSAAGDAHATKGAEAQSTSDRVALERRSAKRSLDAAQAAPKGPFLRGVVTDANGMVLAGATLKLTGEGPAATLLNFTGSPFVERTESGAGGEFKVPRRGLLGDEVTIYVRARGYLPLEASRVVGELPGDVWLDDLELERGVVLGGQVVDADGAPVAGVNLYRTTPDDEHSFANRFFFGSGAKGIESDADGRFELLNEAAGAFVLIATHEDFPRGRLEGDAPFPGFEDTGLVVRLPATATIAGRLVGMPSGRSGVFVHAVPSEVASSGDSLGPLETFMSLAGTEGAVRIRPDKSGNFELTGVDPGRAYELMATLDGSFMNRLRCSERVLARGGDEGLELAWDSGASIVFQLVDAATDKPIKASVVRYRWDDEDFEGFQIGSIKREFQSSQIKLAELRPDPAPAKLDMLITAEGYLDLKREGVLVGEDLVVDLGRVGMHRAPLIRVHVVDALSGKGLRRGRVLLQPDVEEEGGMFAIFGTLKPQSTKGRTESNGWCELAACSSETATLTVRRSGYADYKLEDVVMPTSGQLELEVRLSIGGELEVTIIDSAGNPVGKAELNFRGPTGNSGTATASSKGRLKLKDLPAGEYELFAQRPVDSRGFELDLDGEGDAERPWQRVTVVADAKLKLVLRVPLETRLVGTITANGAALAGADVSLVAGSGEAGSFGQYGGGSSEETDSKGVFELGGLVPGSHRLRIVPGPGAPAQLVGVELVEGGNSTSVDLEIGTIAGRIVDPAGDGIEGARVSARRAERSELPSEVRSALGSYYAEGVGAAICDADGHFELSGVPLDEPLVLLAGGDGFLNGQSDGDGALRAGQRDVVMALSKAATIRVKLVGPAAPFSRVEAASEDGDTRTEWAAGSSVVFQGLEPGTWTLSVQKDAGEEGPSAEVTVAAGEVALVTLER